MEANSEHEHWSQKWEDDVHAVLMDQDAIQADIDSSMRRGDLLGAGTASYEHVLTSYQLGDHREAAAYLAIGIALSNAGTFALPEHLNQRSESFPVPLAITDAKLLKPRPVKDGPVSYKDENDIERWIDINQDVEGDHKIQDEQFTELKQKVLDVSLEAEVILASEDVSALAKNSIVHEAVSAITDLYFFKNRFIPKEDNHTESDIVSLASKMVEHIDTADIQSKILAFEALEKLTLMSLDATGNTTTALRQSQRGLEDIISLFDDSPIIFSKCISYIDQIKSARLSRTAQAVVLPLRNTYVNARPLWGSHVNEAARPKYQAPTRKTRQFTKKQYLDLSLKAERPEMKTGNVSSDVQKNSYRKLSA